MLPSDAAGYEILASEVTQAKHVASKYQVAYYCHNGPC